MSELEMGFMGQILSCSQWSCDNSYRLKSVWISGSATKHWLVNNEHSHDTKSRFNRSFNEESFQGYKFLIQLKNINKSYTYK